MILTHLVLFSFLNGAGGTVTPTVTTPTQEVGGGRRRRRVIIDDIIYEGTEEQIEAKLWELLSAREEEPKPQPVKKKARKKAKPVELKNDYTPQPIYISLPKYRQLVSDSHRQEDMFLTALLRQMYRRYQEEEDDVEALILGLYG